MVWVKSEYAGEFAVLSAWISALVPWYLVYIPDGPSGSSAFYMRFTFLQFRYFPGIGFSENLEDYTFTRPRDAAEIAFQDFELAFELWYHGVDVVVVTLALSVAMYFGYDWIRQTSPVHPVRIMGGLLALQATVFGLSAAVFVTEAPFDSQYPLPLGVVIMLLLAVSLLRVELIEDDGAQEDGDEEPPRDAAAAGSGE